MLSVTHVQNVTSSFIKCDPSLVFVPRLKTCNCRPAEEDRQLWRQERSRAGLCNHGELLTFQRYCLLLRMHDRRVGGDYFASALSYFAKGSLTWPPNHIVRIRQIHNDHLIRVIDIFAPRSRVSAQTSPHRRRERRRVRESGLKVEEGRARGLTRR